MLLTALQPSSSDHLGLLPSLCMLMRYVCQPKEAEDPVAPKYRVRIVALCLLLLFLWQAAPFAVWCMHKSRHFQQLCKFLSRNRQNSGDWLLLPHFCASQTDARQQVHMNLCMMCTGEAIGLHGRPPSRAPHGAMGPASERAQRHLQQARPAACSREQGCHMLCLFHEAGDVRLTGPKHALKLVLASAHMFMIGTY